VVTPSRIPRSCASLIWERLAVSIKNFIKPCSGRSFNFSVLIPENYIPLQGVRGKRKKAGLLHRTAQPNILAAFLPWGGSKGAGRVRPAAANIVHEMKYESDKIK